MEKKHYQVGDVVRFRFHYGSEPNESFLNHAQVMARYDEETVKIEFGYWSPCDEDPVLYCMQIKEKDLVDPDPDIADQWLINTNEERAERERRRQDYLSYGYPYPDKWWGKKPECEE